VAILSAHDSDTLSLTLRGADEDRILTTIRRWPHWSTVAVERDPADRAQCLSVTLTTNRVYETTLREILRRSFGLNFPPDGGESVAAPAPPAREHKRRRY
jgi:hypothetical protein